MEREQTLSGRSRDRTTLGLDYRVGQALTVGARGTIGATGESATGTVRYDRDDRQHYIEGRSDWMGDGDRYRTTAGSRQGIGEDATVYSEYQGSRDRGSEKSLQVWGAEKRWGGPSGFAVQVQGEHARTDLAKSGLRRTALGANAAFVDDDRVDARVKAEVRLEDGSSQRIQYLTDNRVDFSINPDWSVFGRARWSRTEDRRTEREEASLSEHPGYSSRLRTESSKDPSRLVPVTASCVGR